MATQFIAEIGQNHNGDIELAKQLMQAAKDAGVDFVKFQKRDVEIAVPPDEWDILRETPWGTMPYIDYRKRLEFDTEQYDEIAEAAGKIGILWFASVWDVPSVDFMLDYDPPYMKVPSAKLTDDVLLHYLREIDIPIILSTGMSTLEEIDHAMTLLKPDIVMHCTSTYPAPPEELNLRVIPHFIERYKTEIGYSGHETGLAATIAAVALGATWIERHVTLDRSMWGSDQAASVEPEGLRRLVRYIKTTDRALGTGIKKIEAGEIEPMKRLRGDHGTHTKDG